MNSIGPSEPPAPPQGKIWSIVALLAFATVIPELFTGSTPLVAFFNPGILIFLFLGYGVAVLLIRELAVRCRCGLLGLFFLGLAYSVFNEGLIAKTFIMDANLPVPLYDHYGYWYGISFPFAAAIGAWHAGASVIFPILFTHYFFPEAKAKPWLNGYFAAGLGLVLMFLACVGFFGTSEKGVKGHPGQLVILLSMMFVGFLLGIIFKGKEPVRAATSAKKPVLLGFSILVPFWGIAVIAKVKAPLPIFFVALLVVILAYAWELKRQHWLSLPGFLFFGLGWYLHNVVVSVVLVGLVFHDPVRALLAVIADGLVLWLLFRQIRRCETRGAPGTQIDAMVI